MTKRNDIAPYERREARRWTRVTDYVPDAELHVGLVQWERPGSSSRSLPSIDPVPAKSARKRLWLPAAAVALIAAVSLWVSGTFGDRGRSVAAVASDTSSGLTFGLCDEGGMTNCVASGDSFFLAGKSVRIANIDAPQPYGASCPRESRLGRQSAKRLRELLNGGELRMMRTEQDLDAYGLLVRSVAVDGKDVGAAMVASGLAREIGAVTPAWC